MLAVFCLSLGVQAGDSQTKTWTLSHLKRSDSAGTTVMGVTDYAEFWVIIDEIVGDTLGTDSLIWGVWTRADNGVSDTPWQTAYIKAVMDADSASYPVAFYIDAKDSLILDEVRVLQEACLTCDTAWTDSGAAADSGFATYGVDVKSVDSRWARASRNTATTQKAGSGLWGASRRLWSS
jgi:hypothetical protein